MEQEKAPLPRRGVGGEGFSDRPLRLEFPATPSDHRVEVLPVAADSSVLVYTEFRERHEGDPEKHQFSSYDAQLRPRWRTNVHLPAGTEVSALAADGATAYVLCLTPDPRALLIIGFAPRTGAGRVLHYRLPVAVGPLSFEVSGADAYVVATAYRQQTVLRLPLRDSAAGQFLPTLASPVTSVTDAVPEPGGLTVVTAERLDNGSRLLIRPFRANTVESSTFRVLQGPYPANLTSARAAPVPDAARPRLLVGTYATHDPRYAQGVFSTLLPPETAPDAPAAPIFYYDLPTLPHYYDRFGPRHRARAAARARRRRMAGRDVAAHARLLLHRPLPLPDGGALLVAEQYYPRYRSGDTWRYRPFGPGLGSGGFAYGLPGLYGAYDPTTVWNGADGYVYTQALVFVFDAAGRLRWQHTFVLGNVTRSDLRPYVAATVLPGGAIGLAAPADNGERLRHLVLAGPTPDAAVPVEAPIFAPTPPTAAPAERLLDLDDAQVLPWRPGHLLITSFQRIRPAGQRPREVFVIEEVKF